MREKWVSVLDKIIEYCVYGIACSLPVSIAGIEILASIGILAFILKKSISFDFMFFKGLSDVFLLLFIVFCALSLINSGIYIKKSLIALSLKWLEYIFIYLLVKNTFKDGTRMRNIGIILLVVSGIVGIDGLSQKLFGYEFLRHRVLGCTDNGMLAITGPFRHFNDFGVYLLVILSLNIGILLSNKLKNVYKFLLYGLMGLLVICLLLTYSRGSWLGFIIVISFMIALFRKARFLFFLLIIFILLLFFLPGVKDRTIFTFVPPNSIIWNDADRFKMWQTAFRMIKENPFLGKGVGTFMEYFAKYKPNLYVQYAHNCFLQIWAETGIFSLISFLLFLGLAFYRGIRKFTKKNDFILLGLISGMLGFLVHSFFDTDIYSVQPSVLFWVCMGLISAKIDIEV